MYIIYFLSEEWKEMKLIKVTNELRYLEKSKKLTPVEELFSDLNKKVIKEENRMPIVPGFRLRKKEDKITMVVEALRSAIDIEQPESIRICKDKIVEFCKSVDGRVGIPQIARYGIRSTWIHEYQGSFEELLQQCKESVFGSSSVVNNASDIGLVLDYGKEKGRKTALTFGPMEIEQLKSQFLSFELDGIASVFLYADVDVSDMTTKVFSLNFLKGFFDKAIKEGEEISLEIANKVGVKI